MVGGVTQRGIHAVSQEAETRPVDASRPELGWAAADAAGEASGVAWRRWMWLGAGGCGGHRGGAGPPYRSGSEYRSGSDRCASVLLDECAPPLLGRTLAGGSFELGNRRGKVVVVNVWASWCTACEEEHPELEVAARLLAPDGLQWSASTRRTLMRLTAGS